MRRRFLLLAVLVAALAVPATAGAAETTPTLSAPAAPWVLREGHAFDVNVSVGPTSAVSVGDTATLEVQKKAADGSWAPFRTVPLLVTLSKSGPRVWARISLPGRASWRLRVALEGVPERSLPAASAWASLRTVSHNYVVLTFDDGPKPGSTKPIVDTLARNGIRGEFFMLGVQVRGNPALARYVVDHGMRAQNHSWDHANLVRLSRSAVNKQLDLCTRQIASATGTRPTWFRPPYGNRNKTVAAAASSRGLRMVIWTVDPLDWKRPSTSTIVSRVVSHVRPGGVVLMHDGGGDRSHTVAALPKIIAALRRARYDFVTLDEWRALAAQRR
jgi:peptidoglycan/xylan/chitin deacetylase (PgdA/CDA1 family)